MIFLVLRADSPRKLKNKRKSFKVSRFYGATKTSFTVIILKLFLINAMLDQPFLSFISTQMDMNRKNKKIKKYMTLYRNKDFFYNCYKKVNTS